MTGESQDETRSTVDSAVAAFVRDLRLPRRRDDERTELPPDATIADHLEVVRRLGAGAKGVVYLARDRRLRRKVAVKLVAVDSAVAADRAEREA
ncbi:MAG TPA: hypothetical protein VG755_36425, partial [Nannocystaceae bacterium]|nr:hypothetical protein [Nannocystaceae bacterium]